MARSFCGAARSAVSGQALCGSVIYIMLEAFFIRQVRQIMRSFRIRFSYQLDVKQLQRNYCTHSAHLLQFSNIQHVNIRFTLFVYANVRHTQHVYSNRQNPNVELKHKCEAFPFLIAGWPYWVGRRLIAGPKNEGAVMCLKQK